MLIRTPAANGAGDYSPMKRKIINETAGAVRVWNEMDWTLNAEGIVLGPMIAMGM